MADIALNDSHDIDLTSGLMHLKYDADYQAQRIGIALKHRQTEWFRDQGAGTDYDSAILGKATDLTRRAEFRRRILEVPGISEISVMVINLDRATRRLTAEIEVLRDDGEPVEVRFDGRA